MTHILDFQKQTFRCDKMGVAVIAKISGLVIEITSEIINLLTLKMGVIVSDFPNEENFYAWATQKTISNRF